MQRSFQEQIAEVAKTMFLGSHAQQENEDSNPCRVTLDFPPLESPPSFPFPTEITDKHWAGYCCKFDHSWYEMRDSGFTPLDDFGIEYKKVASIFIFNFHFLTVNRVVYNILQHIIDQQIDYPAVVTAGKVYSYLESCLLEIEAFDDPKQRSRIVLDSLDTFRQCRSIFDVNKMNKLTSTVNRFLYLEDSDWIIHSVGRLRNSKWYFPLIPAKLYSNPQFSVKNWDFLI